MRPTTPGSWRAPSAPSTRRWCCTSQPSPTWRTPSGTPRSRRSTRCSCTCCTGSSASTCPWCCPASAVTNCSPVTTSTATCSAPGGSAAGPGGAVRALAPALDWAARRSAGWGRPELDLATRKLEWLAASGDGARNYLLLRNAWDFNSALLRRVYTPDFADRLMVSTRDDYDAYFERRAAPGEPGAAGRVRDQDGVRSAAQRGHHVDGALRGVPCPAPGPRTGPVRRPHPGHDPLCRRPQGAAQGRADRGASRPGAAQAEMGVHL